MGLRIAMIILALVVLPALGFAVAKNHPASHPVVGWTAYPTTTTENTAAEKAEIRAAVAKWEQHHPGGTCTISYSDGAQCETAAGLPTDLVVGVTTVVKATAP